ncbi:MAG: tRNA (adenosine(37)-N6)-threonylcarbamoyltransferase complex ATPase subunit type 1 TsaE [Eubacteriales bacterium]|nr:tRNA (adenosine(37)-N6)-threonylcarbamoyltransferase complex ATPase subunit type 1 TsaE [Eubacteriales bacterium]
MREIIINSEDDTKKLGREIADMAKPGDVLALIGDLGCGKTTLTKYIAEALGATESVTSPTFTIMNEYLSGRMPLYHFDAYRLENGLDMLNIGGDDYIAGDGLCVIEWADKIAEVLPDDSYVIFMEYGDKDGERIYRCTF